MQGDRYFTSDLHFHHKRITEFTARKDFTTAEDHTEWLITLWNSQVKKGDTVWHLGDFSFSSKYEEIEAVVKRLNGQKFFIKGNHCKESVFKKLLQNNLLQKFQQYEEIKIQGNTTCLFHFPITSWHKQGYGSWHTHGHCHGSFQGQGKILDVGLDNAYKVLGEHRFFTENDIQDFMNQRDTVVQDHHKVY